MANDARLHNELLLIISKFKNNYLHNRILFKLIGFALCHRSRTTAKVNLIQY